MEVKASPDYDRGFADGVAHYEKQVDEILARVEAKHQELEIKWKELHAMAAAILLSRRARSNN